MSSLHEVERLDDCEFKWIKKRGIGGKKKDVRFYESFTYDGVDYALYDCVFMYKEGELPYVGKLVKIWENADKSKKIKIHWFFRPSEIAYYLKDADVLENELFLASGEGTGLANVNPLETVAGKCNVVCISDDPRNPQPSVEDLQMADFVFYRCFDVKSCTISDQMGDTVGGLEVKFVFNRRESVCSLDVPKDDMSIKGEGRTAIACKEASTLSAKYLPQEFKNVKPDEHGDCMLAEEATNMKQVQVKQEPFPQVEERVKSARKSVIADDNISKKKIVDGAISSSNAEDTNGHTNGHGDLVVGASLSNNANLKSELLNYSVRSGNDVKLSEIASSLEENMLEETPRLECILAEKLSKSSNEKSESAQQKEYGTGKCKNVGENFSFCGEMSSAVNALSPPETMRSLTTKVSPRETPRSGANPEFEGSEQAEKLVKSSSFTKKVFKTGNDPSKEKLKPGYDAYHMTKDKSLAKDSCPIEGFPRKKAKFDDSIQIRKDNVDNKKFKEKACVGETKKLSPRVTPYDNKEGSKVGKGDLKECHNEKVGKLASSKLPTTTLGGDDGKFGYKTFEVTRRPIVETSNWIKLPWEEKMKAAHDQGRLILLQNFDPVYTSGEIEDIVWCAFKEHCTAKVMQHTAISDPHNGRAFVIFKTRDVADKVVRLLNDGCLMLPNQRPLVASNGHFPKFDKQMTFVGHLTIDKARRREMQEAVSTSHYSQNNTIEYEMALAWCLLQSKSDKWWEKLYEHQRKEVRKLANDLKPKPK